MYGLPFRLTSGLSSVFAALMLKPLGNGWAVTNEYRYDATESRTRTELEHAEAIMTWLDVHYSGAPYGITCYVDPSTPNTFKRILRNKGFRVLAADNDLVPGIVTTATRLDSRDIALGDCPKLRDELQTYSWDETSQERGDDVPIKGNDHSCDALRYFAHSTGKTLRAVAPMTVQDGLTWH